MRNPENINGNFNRPPKEHQDFKVSLGLKEPPNRLVNLVSKETHDYSVNLRNPETQLGPMNLAREEPLVERVNLIFAGTLTTLVKTNKRRKNV